MLTCYYDLRFNPPTFDVVTFLVRAERERLQRGEKDIAIEILPGPLNGFRRDKVWPQEIEKRRAMLHDIVVPMCAMLPSCNRVTVRHNLVSRPARHAFGIGDYSIPFRYFVSCLADGIRPLRPPDDPEKQKGLVTITLREAEHWPTRNSRIEQWREAADRLADMGYLVAVVRDTRKAYEPFGGHKTYPSASIDLRERAKLYRSAECNLFVSNGPAWFCMALDAPTVVVRPTTEGLHEIYGVRGFKSFGIESGGQMPGAVPHQQLFWGDDTAKNIVAALQNFMGAAGPVKQSKDIERRLTNVNVECA